MITLEKVLDEAMSLEPEQRSMLTDILMHRRIEEQREDIATAAHESIAEYRSGKPESMSAEQAVQELRKSLEE